MLNLRLVGVFLQQARQGTIAYANSILFSVCQLFLSNVCQGYFLSTCDSRDKIDLLAFALPALLDQYRGDGLQYMREPPPLPPRLSRRLCLHHSLLNIAVEKQKSYVIINMTS